MCVFPRVCPGDGEPDAYEHVVSGDPIDEVRTLILDRLAAPASQMRFLLSRCIAPALLSWQPLP